MRQFAPVANAYAKAATKRQVLSMDALRSAAPSVFATQAFPGVSERYTFIPTIDVVKKMEREGFMPVMAGQSRFRIEGKGEYAKHIIRFQRAIDIGRALDPKAPDAGTQLIPELGLINSHDRSSGFRLEVGMFRVVCANGLIAFVPEHSIGVRHSGDIAEAVLEAASTVITEARACIERAERMAKVTIDRQHQLKLAEQVAHLRWGTSDGALLLPFPVEKLLEPRRWIDAPAVPGDTHPRLDGAFPKPDLFTTMNVIQENVMKGGIESRNARGRRNSTRAINSVTEDVRVNKNIWRLAEEMMPKLLKGARR